MRLIWFLCSGICHQIPERSLHWQGQALPLCARCTGALVALPLALIALWAVGQGRRSGLPARPVWAVIILATAAWALDGLNSFGALWWGAPLLYETTNGLRLVTGAGLGAALGVVIYPIYHLALWGEDDPRPVLAEPWGPLLPLGVTLACVAGLAAWQSAPYALVTAFVVAGAAATLTLINGLFWALALGLVGRLALGPRIVTALALGCASALVETGALAALRQWLVGA